MTTKQGIKIPHVAPPNVAINHIIKILEEKSLQSTYHPLPLHLGVAGGYRSLVEVVEKRFTAMISDPTIAPSLVFFKKNIILTSLFADAAPESKKKVMTNSYI